MTDATQTGNHQYLIVQHNIFSMISMNAQVLVNNDQFFIFKAKHSLTKYSLTLILHTLSKAKLSTQYSPKKFVFSFRFQCTSHSDIIMH